MTLEDKTEGYVEDLAKVVHGGLFTLHVLGVYYNIRKGKYLDAALHTAIAAYDLTSAVKHSRQSRYLNMDKVREGL